MQSRDDKRPRPFVTSTKRFPASSCGINTIPGPGSYDSSSFKASCSAGVKGYGPFASSSNRLASRVTYTGPGPACYKPADPMRHTYSTAPCSAVFHMPQHSNADHTLAASSSSSPPGQAPGQYSPDVTRRGDAVAWGHHRRASASAAFRGTARSRAAASSARHLATTQLTMQQLRPAVQWTKKELGSSVEESSDARLSKCQGQHEQAKQQKRVIAAAAQLTAKLGALVFKGQPGHWTAARQFHKQPLGQLCNGAAKSTSNAPGPGTYNQPSSAGWARLSPMSVPPLVTAQYRTAEHHAAQHHIDSQADTEQVGCTAIHLQKAVDRTVSQQKNIVHAPHRSKSAGHNRALSRQQQETGMPGPAYYTSQEAPRKASYRRATSQLMEAV